MGRMWSGGALPRQTAEMNEFRTAQAMLYEANNQDQATCDQAEVEQLEKSRLYPCILSVAMPTITGPTWLILA